MCSVRLPKSAVSNHSRASTVMDTAIPVQMTFGSHTVCTLVTAEFLEHQKQVGNDLSTPKPMSGRTIRSVKRHMGTNWTTDIDEQENTPLRRSALAR